MKVGKLVTYLASLYKAGEDIGRFSVLLLGAPGIGKSYSLKETAKSIARRVGKTFIDYSDDLYETIMKEPDKYFVFIDFRLTECEPSDLSGIPEKINGGVRFSPLLWAIVLRVCAGMLCLDELPNVQRPDMISVSYKLVFDQKAGFTKFNKDVFVVAAGNRPEHSAISNLLPTPLISRMIVIGVDTPTIDKLFLAL